jgi:hypothetical protein
MKRGDRREACLNLCSVGAGGRSVSIYEAWGQEGGVS